MTTRRRRAPAKRKTRTATSEASVARARVLDDQKNPTSAETHSLEMAPHDKLLFAELVAKYGLKLIRKTAAEFSLGRSKTGRPKNLLLPFEKASDAAWIDERTEEFESMGHSAPVKAARTLFFFYRNGFEHDNGDQRVSPSESELDAIKKHHLAGRKLLAAMKRPKGETKSTRT